MPQAHTLPTEFIFDAVRDTEIVRVKIDPYTTFEHPATPEYKERFAPQWELYCQGQSSNETPLEHVSWIDPVAARALREKSFGSLERLAGLTDDQLSSMRMPGVRKLRDRAIEALETRDRSGHYEELKREIEELREQLVAQKEAAKPRAAENDSRQKKPAAKPRAAENDSRQKKPAAKPGS